MLPFELSVIDLILAITVIIIIILYITRSSVKTPTEEKPLAEKLGIVLPSARADSRKCPYGFGYLEKLDKDASIPDKCLVCSRIMECRSGIE